MSALRRSLAAGAALAAIGCTFGGLADYDIPACNPDVLLDADGCNSLNPTAFSCVVYQCDRATRRCVRSVLDRDRDGDPDLRCGGHDCKDDDPKISSLQHETCNGVDDNCNGQIDEGLLVASPTRTSLAPTLAIAGDTSIVGGTDTFAAVTARSATSSATCVEVIADPAGPQNVDKATGCSFLGMEPTLSPRQPFAGKVGLTLGMVAVATGSCTRGVDVVFRNGTGGAAKLPACEPNASLPSFATYADAKSVAVAYLDAPLSARSDPAHDCVTATPAALKLRWVENANVANASLGDQAVLTPASPSLRPAALVALPLQTSKQWVLAAAPDTIGVSLWALGPPPVAGGAGTVVPMATIAELADARAASIALGNGAVGIAAELGCAPAQGIAFAVAALDPTGPSVQAFTVTRVVEKGAPLATAPSIAWNAKYGEWWVTWIASEGATSVARLRRLAPDGSPILDALDVCHDAMLASPTSASSVAALSAARNAFEDVAIGCGP